ncbi:MAG: SiaC family regulatory phosphoprotein, partial [Bacteroidales bacterium]
GKSCPVNVTMFYFPLIEWVESLKAKKVKFDINLEYINSSSVKNLLEMLKTLDANKYIKEIDINWFYEEGDDDTLEIGQIFEEFSQRLRFMYHEYAEVA